LKLTSLALTSKLCYLNVMFSQINNDKDCGMLFQVR